MRRRLIAALALLASTAPAFAVDAPAGVSSCSACHASSPSFKTSVPSLAGRTAPEIAGIMREFKSGARPATVMGRIAKGFDDAEIDAMAEWFAKQAK